MAHMSNFSLYLFEFSILYEVQKFAAFTSAIYDKYT